MVRLPTSTQQRLSMALAVGSFLRRLRRDVRANTLAIVAAALVPLAGMVGGGSTSSALI